MTVDSGLLFWATLYTDLNAPPYRAARKRPAKPGVSVNIVMTKSERSYTHQHRTLGYVNQHRTAEKQLPSRN